MGTSKDISEIPLARIRHRAYAALIDYGVFFTIQAAYISSFGSPAPDGGYEVRGVKALPLFLFWGLYFPFIEAWMGQTVGKVLFGLQVVQSSGEKITISQSLKRRLLDPIDLNLFAIPALVAAKNTEGKQRLGDLWASTHVVQILPGEETIYSNGEQGNDPSERRRPEESDTVPKEISEIHQKKDDEELIPIDGGHYECSGQVILDDGTRLQARFEIHTDTLDLIAKNSVECRIQEKWYSINDPELYDALGIEEEEALPFKWQPDRPLDHEKSGPYSLIW